MKISDLNFEPADCCGNHLSAHVEGVGRSVGVVKNADDTYSLALYSDGGLQGRQIAVSEKDANKVLASF